jgi:hypothetical protein
MNPALDRYVEENYDRLMAAAVNILGPEDAGDALHTVLLKLYGMESDRVNAMIESDYVQYYMTRSLINERNDNSTYAPPGIGFRNAAPSGGVESVMRDAACGEDDAPSLSEVLGKVKSAAYDAVSALVKELRLNVRLNDAMKRGANSLDRIVYAKVVMEGHTIRGLEKATGIPRSTLFESYTRVRKALAAEELKFKNE